MKPEFITREQAERQYRDHGVWPDRPCLLPTLLDLHGDILGAADVDNIAEEARRMLANDWHHRWVGCRKNIDSAGHLIGTATTKAPFFAVQLKLWRYFAARQRGASLVMCFAVALCIPRRAPYLVAWTGSGPPPAVTSFPKDGS